MKKIILLSIFILISANCFSNEAADISNDDNDFTFLEYEKLCMKYGKEPSYEEWKNLIENPQCYYDDDFEKLTDEELLSTLLKKDED